ncbi:MAG: hypothetical protein RL238_3390 [Actinomycetota bacterium]
MIALAQSAHIGHYAPVVGLRLIGYWRSEFSETPWPNPRDFVDNTWPPATREMVVGHLLRGRTLEQYRGLSNCRFCDVYVGSKELTDGVYCWPEGLAHYLTEHAVRLPDEFADHVGSLPRSIELLPEPEFDHLGQRQRGHGFDGEYQAWMEKCAEHFRSGGSREALAPNWLNANIDQLWWLHQTPHHQPQG